jgi:hypothetical protein
MPRHTVTGPTVQVLLRLVFLAVIELLVVWKARQPGLLFEMRA